MSAGRSTVRVVLDTNILVSAFYGGVPNEAYQKARRHTIVISEAIRTEWLEVMERIRGRLSAPQSDAFKRLFVEALTFAELVPVRDQVKLCRDASDDVYLSLARAAEADILVTGDDDLLQLERTALASVGLGSLRVLSPRDYLDRA